jgi:hypothetical protein
VGKFYIMDHNSTLPAMMVLWDYIQSGVVDYQYFVGGCGFRCLAGSNPSGIELYNSRACVFCKDSINSFMP